MSAPENFHPRSVDDMMLHIAPMLLGAGVRLFEGLAPAAVKLEPAEVVASPLVTHVRYTVVR